MSKIKLDYSFMMNDWLGEAGFSAEDLAAKKSLLEGIVAKVQKQETAGDLGFLKLLYQDPAEIKNLAQKTADKFQTLVVCGIGGSDLGARAIEASLRSKNKKRLHFTGDTTDPNEIADLIGSIEVKNTAFNIVSQSGSTIETAATFLYLWDIVKKKVGKDRAREHFIITTDPEKGPLRKVANSQNIASLSIPPDVGGRFSVLSSVGLFPAAFIGIDLKKLLDGAKREHAENKIQNDKNKPLILALLEYLAYEKGRRISVLFPYSKRLSQFGRWYLQLMSESLGKERDVFGNSIHFGPTPTLAIGPADQHSQLQLYIEGPNDKIITFIRVEEPGVDFDLPKTEFSDFSYLSGHHFQELLLKEQEATSLALLKNKRPSKTITIQKLDEESLGALFYFFEAAVVYLAAIAQVNPFDQPAVEEGKNIMHALLNRDQYEEKKKEIETLKQNKTSYII